MVGIRTRDRKELAHRPDPRIQDLLGPLEQDVREPGVDSVDGGERDLERPLLGEPVVDLEDPRP